MRRLILRRENLNMWRTLSQFHSNKERRFLSYSADSNPFETVTIYIKLLRPSTGPNKSKKAKGFGETLNMSRNFILNCAFFVLCAPALASAQSGRWGLIVNQKTQQCSRFWEGSECEKVSVPAGWLSAFPEWNEKEQSYKLTVGSKTCAWSGTAPDKCCEALGLKFDKDFKAPSQKTGLEKNPNSMCFQVQ